MKPAFELKSSRLDALTLRILESNLSALNEQFTFKAEQYAMFSAMPFIIDASTWKQENKVLLPELLGLMKQQSWHIVALRHDNEDWSDVAAEHQLMFLSDKTPESVCLEHEINKNNADINSNVSGSQTHTEESVTAVIENDDNTQTNHTETTTIKEILDTPRPTVVIDTPVRTGQQVYAENADLIVLGMVSEGAEVIADGNIHIYAPMRGRALAGEKGDKTARIFMQSMQAELVSIAGIYRIFEQNLPPHLHKQAVRIELVEDRLSVSRIDAQ